MDELPRTASIQAAVKSILEQATEPLYLIRPSAELIEIFVDAATDDEYPLLHVLAAGTELKAVRNHFRSASRAADLIEKNHLTLTPAVPEGWGTAVVTAETAYAFAQVNGQELVMDTSDVPKEIRDTCDDCRDTDKRFSLRTPPWSSVTTTLTESFGTDVCTDFTTMMEVLDDIEAPAVNEVDSALLVAAHHELLLYDLSHWAEDIQLCSKATLSRGKSDFEELGVVNTEKVPTEIGRPRQRLTLTEEYDTLSESELLREVNAVKSD